MRLKFFFSMLAAAAIALTGCNKDQTELEINYGKTATVQGKVTLVQSGQEDKAAADVKVYAQIAYADLVTINPWETPTGNKIFETKTDGEGKYSFELPVVDDGTTVNIFTESKSTEEGFYGSADATVTDLTQGLIAVRDLNMVFNQNATTKTIKVTGILYADSNPAVGFIIYTSHNGKFYTATTNNEGKYEFNLPSSINKTLYFYSDYKVVEGGYYGSNYLGEAYIGEYPSGNDLGNNYIYISR